jgi:phosphinothricin acetyltransferase
LEIPDVAEMQQRILNTVETLPWLVCENDGRCLGYVYAGPYRSRAAYQWGAEVTVYIDSSARRMGIGRALYQSLLNLLILQGYP